MALVLATIKHHQTGDDARVPSPVGTSRQVARPRPGSLPVEVEERRSLAWGRTRSLVVSTGRERGERKGRGEGDVRTHARTRPPRPGSKSAAAVGLFLLPRARHVMCAGL